MRSNKQKFLFSSQESCLGACAFHQKCEKQLKVNGILTRNMSDGNIAKGTSGFVLKGYSEQYGVGLKDIYSHSTRLHAIRIMLQIIPNIGGFP